MADDKLPKVYITRSNGTTKWLSPSHRDELDALVRIGWKTDLPYVVIDGKTIGKILDAGEPE